MEVTIEIELSALIEKLEGEALPMAAARLLEKWCADKGTSHESIYEFFAAITDHQSGPAREQLESMSATYSSASFGPIGAHR